MSKWQNGIAEQMRNIHRITKTQPDLDAQQAAFYTAYRLWRDMLLSWIASHRNQAAKAIYSGDIAGVYRHVAMYRMARAELLAVRQCKSKFDRDCAISRALKQPKKED